MTDHPTAPSPLGGAKLPDDGLHVLVSGTFNELQEYREAVYAALRDLDLRGLGMEQYPARSGDVLDSSLDMADRADVYVGVFSHRYGSYSEAEYHRACERKIPIIVFYPASDDPLNEDDHEVNHQQQYQSFKDLLRSRHVIGTYTTPDNLKYRLVQALHQEIKHIWSQQLMVMPSAILPTISHGGEDSPRVVPLNMPLAHSLIGRHDTMSMLTAMLRTGSPNDVSALTGMGGIGKTVVAAEVAQELADDTGNFPGGVAWISCDGLQRKKGLANLWAKVARALWLKQTAAQPDHQLRRAMLSESLTRRKRTLLVLDNIEPGLDVGILLDTLSVRDHTVLLLTARQRIASYRATAIELAPLEPSDARTLFMDRLAQAGGSLPIPAESPLLDTLLEMVGGLPLAVELTAAYVGVRHLMLATVIREVEADGIKAPAFHDTPKRALVKRFDRSWEALTPSQQVLFASLSLLEGASFSHAAANALAQAIPMNPGSTGDEGDPKIDLLMLVNYAVVQALPNTERLRLHPLLREYAAQKFKLLPLATQAYLGDSMVAYWLKYAQFHSASEDMDALRTETAGLTGAVIWSHRLERHRETIELMHSLSRFLFVCGLVDDARLLRPWAIHAALALDSAKEVLWAVHELAMLDGRTNRVEEARAGFQRALALAQQLGDLASEQAAVRELALLYQKLGRLEEARRGYEQALQLSEQLGDPAVERTSVHDMAVINYLSGRILEARIGFERSLSLARSMGEPYVVAVALSDFGHFLSQETTEEDRARTMITESIEISKQLSYVYRLGKCYQYLAWLDNRQQKRGEALTHYREALHCFVQVQAPEVEEVRGDLFIVEANAEIVAAVQAFTSIKMSSSAEIRNVLEKEQALLLTDEADQILSVLISQVRQNVDHRAQRKRSNVLSAYRVLLHKAREAGISAAVEYVNDTARSGMSNHVVIS
jgi:tetratricopeptide (TPR) repeat protein